MPGGRLLVERNPETTVEKVRNVSPVKINEFRVSDGSPANPTNSFIELYNAGAADVDSPNWSLTEHATQQAILLGGENSGRNETRTHGFYLLGLSNSGLAVPARAGRHPRLTSGTRTACRSAT